MSWRAEGGTRHHGDAGLVDQEFREGVVIAEVAPGSTAAKVGLQQGDVILAVNDAKIARTADLQRAAEPRRNWWKLTLGRGGQIITTAMGG